MRVQKVKTKNKFLEVNMSILHTNVTAVKNVKGSVKIYLKVTSLKKSDKMCQLGAGFILIWQLVGVEMPLFT